MKLHVFFSVHERLFAAIIEALQREHGLGAVSGFVWGKDQLDGVASSGVKVAPLTIFTQDILDQLDDTPADLAYLAEWERRCGVSLQHMIFAERHLSQHYSYERVLRLAELIFRRTEADFDAIKPDAYFSEDVSCLTSYIHWAVAHARGIHIVFLANARFPRRVTTYGNPYQRWDLLEAIFPDTPAGLLSDDDLAAADRYIRDFRDRPRPPTGILFRAKFNAASRFDLSRLVDNARRWSADDRNPTLRSPAQVIAQRGRRLVRNYLAEARGLFDKARPDERYVLYPLHFQPEATTLVLAPYYLNQLALIEDLAKSLPAGHRLYVKEHMVSRGRWPLSFYEDIRRVPGVRLLSPAEDAAALIRGASAVAVVTGTMGLEALLLDKPAVTFGHIFYNLYPLTYRGGEVAKQDWPALFRKAIFEHRTDDELLRRFIACAFKATFPGVTGNATSVPEIMAPDNVRGLIRVVAQQLGLVEPVATPRAEALGQLRR